MIANTVIFRRGDVRPARFRATARLLAVFACLCVALIGADRSAAQTAADLTGPTLKLFQAVEVNDMPGVKEALGAGAVLDAKNAAGKTAADVAVDKGHFIIAHFLLSARSPAKTTAQAKPAAKAAPARRVKPKLPAPAPRRLAPRTTQTPVDQPSRRAAPQRTAERRFPMPPRKPAQATGRAAATTPKFGAPPRKPPAPLPQGTDIAAVPGLKADEDDLLADLDSDADQAPPVSPVAADAPPKRADSALGPVGRFFDTLLNLVRPDDPEPAAEPTPRRPPTDTAAPATASPAGEAPLASDLADLNDSKQPDADAPADEPDLSDLPDDAKTADDPDADLDDALADLDKPDDADTLPDPSPAPDDAADADAPRDPDDVLAALDEELSEDVVEVPKVRRVGPEQPPVQKAQPVAPVAKAEAPASSTAGRTVERLQNLIGDKPKEDEFGLPVIDVPGSAPDEDPTAALVAEIDEEKLEDSPASDDLLADALPKIDEGEDGAADLADADDPAVPKSAPTTPVEAMPAPRGRSPRYQSTLERLRRLNEAVAREVRVDPNAILSEGRRLREQGEVGAETAPAVTRPRTMPPSPVRREKLVRRETPDSRMADRLERIRRDIYDSEEEAEKARAAKLAAAEAARRKAEMVRLEAREATPDDADAVTDKQPPGVVGALAQFFKAQEREAAAKAGVENTYRQGHDQGEAAGIQPDADAMKIAEAAVAPPPDEPKPGQKPGSLSPGFLDSLSQLFTNQKTADDAWAADVEVPQPVIQAPAEQPPSLKPVDAAGTRPAPAPLEAPADAQGGAWTTTVEMQTETGDPLVLQVSKSPDPGSAPPPAAAGTAPARAPAPVPTPADAPDSPDAPAAAQTREQELADLPSLESDTPESDDNILAADDSDLPAADDELRVDTDDELRADTDDDLPPAEGEEAEGPSDDLPPAEGEAPAKTIQPAKRTPRGPLPYSDPLRAPDPIPARGSAPVPGRSLPRLAELKPGPEDPASGRDKLRLAPEETLTDGQRRYPTQGQMATRQAGKSRQTWPVTSLAKNDVTPVPRRRPAMLSRTSLTGATFTLGESVSLENSLPPEDGTDGTNQCVKKNRGTTLFCVEPVDWPEALLEKFVVPTILYTGPMAIIRYDQGAASRLHALFPSNEFETVVKFYQERYGTPTEIWKRSIAPLAEPRRENPTVAWRSRDPKTNAVTILELRQYDDTRGGFPDTGRGAVMLYLANSPAIFPQVSSHELMRLKRDQVKQPG